MDTYEWQLNHAIVLRLYYVERMLESTVAAGLLYSYFNMRFMREGYMDSSMRGVMARRTVHHRPYIAAGNAGFALLMCKPLRKEEI